MNLTITFKMGTQTEALALAQALQRASISPSDQENFLKLRSMLDGTPILSVETKGGK